MVDAARLAMIVNPLAGKGKGGQIATRVARHLRALGAEVTEYSGNSAAETRQLTALALESGPDALVVVGGDGTLASMIDALQNSPVPVALVPAGTGNDFARALDLPIDSLEAQLTAAALALHGEVREIDIASATCPDGARRFLTVAAIGFDAHVSERTNRLRWPRGAARYYLALVIELLRLRPLNFSISVNGHPAEQRPGILVAVANTRSYGGGLQICPNADPSDGMLEMTHIGEIGRFKLLRLFPLLLRAAHLSRPEVWTERAREMTISAPDLVVYADGERIGTRSVTIEVISAALRVFVPKEGA